MAQALRFAVRYLWVIVLFGVTAGGLAYLVSNTLPKQYESEARVLIGSLTEADLQRQLGYRELAGMYAAIADSPLVLNDVADHLGIEESLDELKDRVDGTALVGEAIVRVSATAESPSDAAALADAVSAGLIELSVGPAGPVTPPVGTISLTPQPSLVQIIQPAVEDESAASPNVLLNSAVAAFAGMALGLLIALLADARLAARRRRPATVAQHSVQHPYYPPRPQSP
jgi:capsular polysaccharide biosynthesis protein